MTNKLTKIDKNTTVGQSSEENVTTGWQDRVQIVHGLDYIVVELVWFCHVIERIRVSL